MTQDLPKKELLSKQHWLRTKYINYLKIVVKNSHKNILRIKYYWLRRIILKINYNILKIIKYSQNQELKFNTKLHSWNYYYKIEKQNNVSKTYSKIIKNINYIHSEIFNWKIHCSKHLKQYQFYTKIKWIWHFRVSGTAQNLNRIGLKTKKNVRSPN